MDDWNIVENSDIVPHKYAQLVLTKMPKQFTLENIAFQQMCWSNGTFVSLKNEP